jgi:hypothetical protein
METLTSSIGTHVEGGRRKIISKVKGKLKDKMIKPPSSDANQSTFVEVPLNQILGLQTTYNMVRKRSYYPTYSSHPSS